MVCSRCEKKMGKLIVPDKWKDGARNVTRSADDSQEGRQVDESGVMRSIKHSRKTLRDDPMGKGCRICGMQIDREANYCTNCAFKRGICARCGRKIQDTKFSKMSTV